MKLAVRLVLVIVGALAGIVVVGGLLLRSQWRVETAVFVAAPPEAVFHYVDDLRSWSGWTLWNSDTDPTAQWEFNDHLPGPGQSMSWHGDRLGDGRLEIVEANPRTGIRYVERIGRFDGAGAILLVLEQGGTRVTWTDTGDVGWNLPARFAVRTIETELQPELAKALARLKSLAEATQPGRLSPAPILPPHPDLGAP